MKIDSDLRVAVRAAAKVQPQRDYAKERTLQEAEILRVVTSTPERRRQHERHQKNLKRAAVEYGEAQRFYNGLGVNTDTKYVQNDNKFKAAGGKTPPKHSSWRAEVLLGKLAVATPAQGAKLLKEHGIVWE